MRITGGRGERPCRREQTEDAEGVIVAAEEEVVEEEVETVAGVEEARTAYAMFLLGYLSFLSVLHRWYAEGRYILKCKSEVAILFKKTSCQVLFQLAM